MESIFNLINDKVVVKIIREGDAAKPEYQTPGSAGADIRAFLKDVKTMTLQPLERVLVKTGIKLEIPQGYEVQVRPRSGLSIKHGITLINTPGTIDSDYRGELGIGLINLSNKPFTFEHGERLAQLVLKKVEQMEFLEVEMFSETVRGENGYGSTGGYKVSE